MDLSFLQSDLQALEAYLASRADPSSSDWHVTHNMFLRTEASRSAVVKALETHGLFTSYQDVLDHGDFPFWLDMMERVSPTRVAVEASIQRVLEVLGVHDGDYNSFTVIGSRGESFPA